MALVKAKIRVGHSPDADDAFMFYAIAHDKVRTDGMTFSHVIEDIETLNRRAFRAELEVTAVSAFTFFEVADKYALMPCGASIGDNYGPVLVAKKLARIPPNWAWAAWAHLAAIWVFSACLEYTLRHQWQDGVRYLVPSLPPLFLLVADVLMRVPRWLAWPLVGYSLFTSWCVAMTRSHPWDAMATVLTHGPQFPWLTTLSSAARQYFPPLGDPQSAWSIWLPWVVCVTVLLCGGGVYHLTRPRATVN